MANIDRARIPTSSVSKTCHLLAAMAEHFLPLSRASQVRRREGGIATYRMNSTKSEMQEFRPQSFLQLVNRNSDPFSTGDRGGVGEGCFQNHLGVREVRPG